MGEVLKEDHIYEGGDIPNRGVVRIEDIEYTNRSTLAEIPQIECDWDAMMAISTDAAARINELCAR